MTDPTAAPPQAEEEGFAIIPRYVLQHPDLTYADKIIYGRLLSLMQNKRGYCWADNEFISNSSGVKHRTVERVIPKLASLGLVRLTGGQNQARRIYPPDSKGGTLPQRRRSTLPQNGGAAPAKRRSSSRSSSRTDTHVNSSAEKAQTAERVLAYHEERRKVIQPGARAIGATARVECINLIGALLTDDAWTEERLMRVVDGHLADGSFWREEGHTHPRYAFRDEVNAERMEAMCAPLGLEPEDSEDDWPSVEEQEEPETWEGLEQSTGDDNVC